jgi:hypothetical protein
VHIAIQTRHIQFVANFNVCGGAWTPKIKRVIKKVAFNHISASTPHHRISHFASSSPGQVNLAIKRGKLCCFIVVLSHCLILFFLLFFYYGAGVSCGL